MPILPLAEWQNEIIFAATFLEYFEKYKANQQRCQGIS